uniref:Unkown protein n=1 Tax=Riptortus pedestris TaxID=329032 RepID=R4WS87_RIPPE|nr:unkown protein [Riptortus pedestris]
MFQVPFKYMIDIYFFNLNMKNFFIDNFFFILFYLMMDAKRKQCILHGTLFDINAVENYVSIMHIVYMCRCFPHFLPYLYVSVYVYKHFNF